MHNDYQIEKGFNPSSFFPLHLDQKDIVSTKTARVQMTEFSQSKITRSTFRIQAVETTYGNINVKEMFIYIIL